MELEAGGARVLLDLGLPLDANPDEPVALPKVQGLSDGGPGLLGVVVSHAHLTPYLVDHSAYDAYALLVEADGRRLFYSGDLCAHGRKPGAFRQLLQNPPRSVDVLLLEGTRVRDVGEDGRSTLSEADLEVALAERFRATEGLGIVLASGQNLDRLVTAYRAARRAGRTLVVDLYTATLARATGRLTMPQPGTHDIRVYVPTRQRLLVKESGEFERTRGIASHRVYLEELRASSRDFALLAQTSTLAELGRDGCLDGASATWSMWAGYLDADTGQRVHKLLEQCGVPLRVLHASGHASVNDLRRLAQAIAPRRVVPVHTAAPARYREVITPTAELRQDEEWWEV